MTICGTAFKMDTTFLERFASYRLCGAKQLILGKDYFSSRHPGTHEVLILTKNAIFLPQKDFIWPKAA